MATNIQTGSFVGLEVVRQTIGLRGEDVERDGILVELINQATGFMESFTGRLLYRRAYSGVTFDGSGELVVFSPEYPIESGSVSSLKYEVDRAFASADELVIFDGTGSQTTHDVVIDYGSGELTLVNGDVWPDGVGTIRMSYTAGLTAGTAPELVKAQSELVAMAWFARGRDPKTTAVSIGGVSQQLFNPGSRSASIPDSIRDALIAHKRPAYAA